MLAEALSSQAEAASTLVTIRKNVVDQLAPLGHPCAHVMVCRFCARFYVHATHLDLCMRITSPAHGAMQ